VIDSGKEDVGRIVRGFQGAVSQRYSSPVTALIES